MALLLPSRLQHRDGARFVLAGVISLLAWSLLGLVAPGAAIPWTPAKLEAARTMKSGLDLVARHCRDMGIPFETGLDPNGTCVVGPEITELFTSLGQLEAKRTTTTPDMAGLLVHLLGEAGVEEGERVAVGASGSFPALLLATLSAVEALGAEPVTILSLGASSFGATRPAFHLLDLYQVLKAGGLVSFPPAAVSLGGSGDQGMEFDPDFRAALLQELLEGEVPVLRTPDFRSNVAERMALYGPGPARPEPAGRGGVAGVAGAEEGEGEGEGEGAGEIAAFVNIGGAEVNLGLSPMILALPPGLVEGVGIGGPEGGERLKDLPPENQRGVLFEMVSRGVPVIHLLHVRGLALRYGLPWDPLPLPEPGSTPLRDGQKGKGLGFWFLTVGYFGALALVAFSGKREGDQETVR